MNPINLTGLSGSMQSCPLRRVDNYAIPVWNRVVLLFSSIECQPRQHSEAATDSLGVLDSPIRFAYLFATPPIILHKVFGMGSMTLKSSQTPGISSVQRQNLL